MSTVTTPIEIVEYDGTVAAAHAAFAQRNWPNKRRRREDRFNRWKFRGPEQGAVPGLLLARRGDEIVGQTGALPAEVRIGGERLACQWICDIMVDAALRGRGVGAALLEAAKARGLITLGSNASPSADASMRRNGFQLLAGPEIAVLPLDPAHVLGWKTPAALRGAIPIAAAALRPVARWRARRLYHANGSTHGVRVGTWNDAAPHVEAEQSRQPEPHIVHDAAFLRWRCGGLPGFVEPLTSLTMPDGSYAIVGPGAPLYYVYDWHAADRSAFLALFAAALQSALAARAATLQAYANLPIERAWLEEAGFIFLRRHTEILCHPPERFLPAHPRMRYSIFDSDGNL